MKKHFGIALTAAQQGMRAASGPWCMAAFLELSAAMGARRGEVLALRWSDVQDGRATIARSLTQTKQGLEFKGTNRKRPPVVKIPESTAATLEAHRKQQIEFRRSDYHANLDLISVSPDGTPLKPDSVSASVSFLFQRLKLPKVPASTPCDIRTLRISWRMACRCR